LRDCATTGRAPLSSNFKKLIKLLLPNIKCPSEHPLIHDHPETLVGSLLSVDVHPAGQNLPRKDQHGRLPLQLSPCVATQATNYLFSIKFYIIFSLNVVVKHSHNDPIHCSTLLNKVKRSIWLNTSPIIRKEVSNKLYFGSRFLGHEMAKFDYNNWHFSTVQKSLLIIGNIEPHPGPPSLSLCTLNCRGLSDRGKFLRTISKLKKFTKKAPHAIICLQETHCLDPELIKCTWADNFSIANGASNARGVCILFKNLPCTEVAICPEGRSLICKTEIQGSELFICNLYAPNDYRESYTFFSSILPTLNDLFTDPSDSNLILAGDFNLHLDGSGRRRTGSEIKVINEVTESLADLNLHDACQISTSPNNFTWYRQESFSRIDYIYVSVNLLEYLTDFRNVWKEFQSDHALVNVGLAISQPLPRGRSYLKINKLDISDPNHFLRVKNVIENCIEEAPKDWNPHLLLDYVKMRIRSEVLLIRKESRLSSNDVESLKSEIQNLLDYGPLDKEMSDELQKLSVLLHKAEEKESESLRLRAGIKWREQGERSTKFFLNQIKSNQASGYLRELDTSEGNLTDTEGILKYVKAFYENLYSDQSIDDAKVHSVLSFCPMLGNDDVQFMNSSLTLAEIKESLNTCDDSCPGMDSIPYSFYKVYSKQLLPLIMNSWAFSVSTGRLPISQRTSCITIIPKKGKDLTKLGNWRPISVSSCDIKIITKALSIKIAKVLPKLPTSRVETLTLTIDSYLIC